MAGERVRIGVVGVGWFASRRHLPDIGRCAGAKLAAICRRNEAELERLAEHFGRPPAYTDYAEMLADEVVCDQIAYALIECRRAL